MSLQVFNRLESLDFLIRTKSTGSPAALSSRLGISERTLYHFLTVMKSLGAPIAYSKTKNSYYYKVRGYFTVGFQEKVDSSKSEPIDID